MYLAGLYKVVQSLHRLLGRCRGVEGMHLKQVDVGRAETLERCLDLVEERGAREPTLIHIVAGVVEVRAEDGDRGGVVFVDEEEHLGEDDNILARDIVLLSPQESATQSAQVLVRIQRYVSRSIVVHTFLMKFPRILSESPLE